MKKKTKNSNQLLFKEMNLTENPKFYKEKLSANIFTENRIYDT